MSAAVRVLSYLKRYWTLETLIILCLLGVTAANIIVPLFIRTIIDNVIPQRDYSLLLTITLAILAATALRGFLAFAWRYSTEYIAQKAVYNVRNQVYETLQRQSFTFYDKMPTGELMSRVTSDVDMIRGFLAWGFPQFISIIATFTGVFAITISISWKLTLLAISTAPILLLVTIRFSRKIRPVFIRGQEQLAVINAVLQENITGVKVVRAFAKENLEEQKFAAKSRNYFDNNIIAAKLRATHIPVMELMSGLGTVLILLFGGIQVISGEITIGTLVLFNSYLLLLLMPMRYLGFITSYIQRALAGAKRTFEILDATPEIKDTPSAKELNSTKGHVKFDNVSFSYGQEPVLKNVTFEAKPGETVALLGATGSGKTSIISLIPRFYDTTAGELTLDGTNVKKIKIKSLRKHVGIVHQETFLFSTTIKENIAYGSPNATMEQIIEAAKAAEAHDFIIAFPEGYNTLIGERGSTLSGGQKQRVAIARALLKNPRILILDDSTSSVDIETEYQIQKALQTLLRNRTTFVITQRLSTIKNAHKIIVLDSGEIAEMGTHEELVKKNGLYRRIYETQLAAQAKPEAQVQHSRNIQQEKAKNPTGGVE
jgi:ABC-type multidrug transport system fused ATPase/permease subunit